MENLVQSNLDAIARLCRQYQVRRLAVFGSILRSDFDPQNSDADFLVEFEPVPGCRPHEKLSCAAGGSGLSVLPACGFDRGRRNQESVCSPQRL